MRELVYMSEAKLEQFLPELRSLWPQPSISIKVPFGGLQLDPAVTPRKSQLKHLKRVVRQVQRSARWFSDEYLCPGEWAAFEAPLNFLVTDCGRSVRMLFFVDLGQATARYPSGAAVRLILHGSPQNLLSTSTSEIYIPQGSGEETTPDFSVNPAASGCSVPASFGYVADNVAALLRTLGQEPDPASPARGEHLEPPAWYLPRATMQLLEAIDARVHPETAAWMRGYARITAILMDPRPDQAEQAVRYVVATPLYVERSTAISSAGHDTRSS